MSMRVTGSSSASRMAFEVSVAICVIGGHSFELGRQNQFRRAAVISLRIIGAMRCDLTSTVRQAKPESCIKLCSTPSGIP